MKRGAVLWEPPAPARTASQLARYTAWLAFDALVGVASERLAHRATGARRPGA
jgi:hypothetical protein